MIKLLGLIALAGIFVLAAMLLATSMGVLSVTGHGW